MKPTALPTQERLRELFDYNPETGLFTRRINRGKAKAGDVAGGITKKGYLKITVDGTQYYAQRLALQYMGLPLGKETDHINGDRTDNRIANLRAVTTIRNQRNTKLRTDNASGYRGVHWLKKQERWEVQMRVEGKRIHLGTYVELDDAIAARIAADKEHGFTPVRIH